MSDSSVTTRAVEPGDRPVLDVIQERTLAEPTPALLTAVLNGVGIGLVATDEAPVGYAIAVLADEVAYISELAVLGGYRRQGIGTALVEEIADRARTAGARELRLTVRADDERARDFYRDRAFRTVDRRPKYYETGSGVGLTLARTL